MPSILNATTTTGLVSSGDNSGSLQLATNNGTAALTIDTSQNVGIGTASPDTTLTVQATGANGINLKESLSNSTLSTRLFLSNATAGQSVALYNNAGNLLFTTGATPSSGSGTERMRIDSVGNIGVNTTPSPWLSTYKTIQGGSLTGGPSGIQTSASISFRTDYSQLWLYAGGYRDSVGNQVWTSTRNGTNYVMNYGMDAFNGYFNWQISNSANGTAGATATLQSVLSINPNGAVSLLGGTGTVSGVGIEFPATQSASSNANTLDDYEEGTWTPAVWGGGNISSAAGRYIKIGKQVYVSWDVQYGSTGNGDAAGFQNLPFTVFNANSAQGCTTISYNDYGSGFVGLVIANSTRVVYYNLSGTTLQNANFSLKRVMGGAVYEVA